MARSSGDPSRPAFAEGFPREPALDALVTAFARGDFRRVREEAPKLAASAEDDAVKRAATELRARIEPDRMVVALMLATGVLLGVLTVWWIAHAHTPPPATSAPRAAPTVTVEHVR